MRFVQKNSVNFVYLFQILLILVKRILGKQVIIMKIFKSAEPASDGYSTLVDHLQQTSVELKNVYTNLENVVEPDLIDYYIYQAKAVSMRYKFLINCAKQLENI